MENNVRREVRMLLLAERVYCNNYILVDVQPLFKYSKSEKIFQCSMCNLKFVSCSWVFRKLDFVQLNGLTLNLVPDFTALSFIPIFGELEFCALVAGKIKENVGFYRIYNLGYFFNNTNKILDTTMSCLIYANQYVYLYILLFKTL